MLGADLGAFAHECALPDPVVALQGCLALRFPLIARVHVVTVAEGNRGRAQELRFQPVHRARRVTEHAVNTLSELVVGFELGRSLQVLALRDRLLRLADDPRLDALELIQKVAHVDDEVPDDWKVG
jgi:hypothetical protein